MISPLLHLCSRATTSPELRTTIAGYCRTIKDWDELPALAEQQGLAPLLHWHLQNLDISYPDQIKRALRLLFLRHRQLNQIMATTLKEVLTVLRQANIDVLVLKGAALSHTVYPEIGLRPMRDMDLLLRKEQAGQALDILVEIGFYVSNAPRPDDHFHLPALYKKAGGVPVCIELHHGLFPDCPPYYHKPGFDDLLARSRTFNLQGFPAYCLGNEDMLWHVFEHGFHMPLTYEAFKLISMADLFTIVEKQFEVIDWDKMKSKHPRILAALPLFHHLTPWPENVLAARSWRTPPVRAGAGKAFQGWPHLRLAEQRDKKLLTLLKDTFLPPEWWTRLYYGVSNRWELLVCRWIIHPRHVFWWVRLYTAFLQSTSVSSGGNVRRLFGTALSLLKKISTKGA